MNAHVPEGDLILVIEARGQSAIGHWPYLALWVDDRLVGGAWIESREWKKYKFPILMKAGNTTIKAEFINDYGDRNLYLGKLELYFSQMNLNLYSDSESKQ